MSLRDVEISAVLEEQQSSLAVNLTACLSERWDLCVPTLHEVQADGAVSRL